MADSLLFTCVPALFPHTCSVLRASHTGAAGASRSIGSCTSGEEKRGEKVHSLNVWKGSWFSRCMEHCSECHLHCQAGTSGSCGFPELVWYTEHLMESAVYGCRRLKNQRMVDVCLKGFFEIKGGKGICFIRVTINFYDLVDGIPKCAKPHWLPAAPGRCSGHWLGIPMSSPIFRGALQNAGWGSGSSLGQGRASSSPHLWR